MKIIECCGNDTDKGAFTDHIQEQICQRHRSVFGRSNQDRISELTIGVVSTGGLGSVIIEQLMRLFPYKLIYIDKDHVELSNLNRLVGATQIDAKLRTSKVDVASRNIFSFHPTQEVTSINGDFLDEENQKQFKACDFIFGASDSNAVRLAANCLCLAHGIPYLDCGVGAISSNGRLEAAGGQVIKILPDSGFCLHCGDFFNMSVAMKSFLPETERLRLEDRGYIRGEEIAAPQVYSLNMMVASWAVWSFMRIVSGEILNFDGIAIDAKDLTAYPWTEKTRKNGSCPTCGPNGIVFAGDQSDLLTREQVDPEINIPSIVQENTVSEELQNDDDEIPTSETDINSYLALAMGEHVVAPFNLGLWI